MICCLALRLVAEVGARGEDDGKRVVCVRDVTRRWGGGLCLCRGGGYRPCFCGSGSRCGGDYSGAVGAEGTASDVACIVEGADGGSSAAVRDGIGGGETRARVVVCGAALTLEKGVGRA